MKLLTKRRDTLFERYAAMLSLLFVFLLSFCAYKGPVEKQQVTLHVACLGDSITYGYKLADRVHKSYPALLSQQSDGLWHVLNLGVNGATVIKKGDIPIIAQKAYQRLISSEPDVVMIMLGTNATKNTNWQFIGDFVSDYAALIGTIERLSPRSHIIICSIPPVLTDRPSGISADRTKEINILVKKVVDIAGVDFIDINNFLSKKPSLFIDGIHPNVSGDQKIANMVFKKISTL